MTESSEYKVADRRPIAARRLAIMHRAAGALARMGVSANAISLAGMFCGMAAGACLWGTSHTGGFAQILLWLATAAFVQGRLLANLLDGMVAIQSHTASALGEIYNDLPDRISDAATLVGFGYAAGGLPELGWLAAVLALLTAYIRTLGKASGMPSDFRGPMAKQHRMFLVTVVSVFCACAVGHLHEWRPAMWGLVVICAGSLLTCVRRLLFVARHLRARAA